MFRIVIVDDHRLFREGLKLILQEEQNYEIAGEFADGHEFIKFLNIVKPDLVLLDINMPVMNGIDAAKKALEIYPDLNILILSMLGEEDYYNELMNIGVKGFLLKDSDTDELLIAIEKILGGAAYFSQQLLMQILQDKSKREQATASVTLTPRELEVLTLLCEGLTNAEIAEKLFLSQRTVDRHKSNLFMKCECTNSVGLVMYALKNKIVQL
ncbi:MAG: response regulator transcription factor [Marinilabiliaceae bacterium]|nr:response regulator transcription factor [Marinilabiliaceae bacterium]